MEKRKGQLKEQRSHLICKVLMAQDFPQLYIEAVTTSENSVIK